MMANQHRALMKRRLQIQLEPSDYRALKAWAARAGVSMSGAVRLLIRERPR